MHRSLPHANKLALFAALSAADLGLTCWLLYADPEGVVEANPLAAWWLASFGWVGLTGFKCAAVLAAAGLCIAVARHRPRVGGHLLAGGCAVLAVVVGYSGVLAGHAVYREDRSAADLARLRDEEQHLDRGLNDSGEYRRAARALGDEVLAGGCSLPEAGRRLACVAGARAPELLGWIRLHHPKYTDEQCWAWSIVQHGVMSRHNSPSWASEVATRLGGELESAYGISFEVPEWAVAAGPPAPLGRLGEPHAAGGRGHRAGRRSVAGINPR